MIAPPVLFKTRPLTPGVFLERPNRFLVRFRSGDIEGFAHLANPGRLGEILLPGTQLLLQACPQNRLGRKAVAATWSERWPGDQPRGVYLDTMGINHVAARLIDERLVPELRGYRLHGREIADGRSRIDFLLCSGRRRFLLEVKSATLPAPWR